MTQSVQELNRTECGDLTAESFLILKINVLKAPVISALKGELEARIVSFPVLGVTRI